MLVVLTGVTGEIPGEEMEEGARRSAPRPAKMSPDRAQRFLDAARELIGVPYELGGRMQRPGEGLDCQGVLFYAAERIGRCGWKSFSVMPTESVSWGELGVRVPGLDPVGSARLKTSLLVPGDIIWLVDPARNPAEPAIGELDGRPVWVWHTGIYTEEGHWIHANYFTGEVTEESLTGFLEAHPFPGVFVTRMSKGPRPRRCRRHARMKLRR